MGTVPKKVKKITVYYKSSKFGGWVGKVGNTVILKYSDGGMTEYCRHYLSNSSLKVMCDGHIGYLYSLLLGLVSYSKIQTGEFSGILPYFIICEQAKFMLSTVSRIEPGT